MTIKPGDRLPEVTLQRIRDGVENVDTRALFDHTKVVIFAVPGAFTPTCSEKHLPGFVQQFDAFRDKGVEVACVSVNDPFVMSAWNERDGSEHITMLADGNGEFAEALGLTMDGSKFGMGKRSQRYSMVVNDGVVEQLNVEEPGAFNVSSADYMLERL